MSAHTAEKDAAVCKHCDRPLAENGTHAEGRQRGKNRCDPADSGLPYGYDAAPVGEPCRHACLGYEAPCSHTPKVHRESVAHPGMAACDGRFILLDTDHPIALAGQPLCLRCFPLGLNPHVADHLRARVLPPEVTDA